MMHGQKISGNEIYLLIKYIKSFLWRAAKRMSYIQDARCLNIKPRERAFKQFKSPVLNVLRRGIQGQPISQQKKTGGANLKICSGVRLRLKCDGTREETRFRLSAKQTKSI